MICWVNLSVTALFYQVVKYGLQNFSGLLGIFRLFQFRTSLIVIDLNTKFFLPAETSLCNNRTDIKKEEK